MEVILKIKSGKGESIIKTIESQKRKFPKIQKITKYTDKRNHYVLVTYDIGHFFTDQNISKLEKKYKKLFDVIDVKINQAINSIPQNISTKNCHFVFDVDSTLTTGRGTIQNKIRNIFHDMTENDSHRVYLASGRSMEQLRQDIQDFKTESYGIAENGGILLGFGKDGYLPIGDRFGPDEVLKYVKTYCPNVKEDIKQGMRLTERIFRATIKEDQFLKYVKKSKAKVNVLASKNSYHVTGENIDKGFALEKLKTKLQFGQNDIIIGIGDSDLDISLLDESDHKFVVGNASKKVKSIAISLGKNYADGVEEMYETWFKSLN